MHPDHYGSREEEVLQLVCVAVGAHVEKVLVPAELLEREAAPLDEDTALGHVRLADREAGGRALLDVNLWLQMWLQM